MDKSYITENSASRERLKALITKLSDEDLALPMENGWTIAETLAHLAFWDQLTLANLKKWKRDGFSLSSSDAHTINEAVQKLCESLPVGAAAQLAIDAAEDIDNALEVIPPELIDEINTAGKTRALKRDFHRHEHLDRIEEALRAR